MIMIEEWKMSFKGCISFRDATVLYDVTLIAEMKMTFEWEYIHWDL